PFFPTQSPPSLPPRRPSDLLLPAALPALSLPRSARRINDAMAEYAANRIEAVVGSLTGRSALLLGVAYRGAVREAAFSSARLLQDRKSTRLNSSHQILSYAD